MAATKTKVKICGLTDAEAAEVAAEAGAQYLGAVFYPPSPRAVTFQRAAEIFEFVPAKVQRVGLFVDPTDADIDKAMNSVRLDLIQLHGAEAPERVEAIRLEFGMPVIKAVGIGGPADLEAARAFDEIADFLLFDAKPDPKASRPGGNGAAFDWSLLKGGKWKSPWFLAGGLTVENVAAAIAGSAAKLVDVSSGVEKAPGVKDLDRVAAFIAQARGAAIINEPRA